MKFRQADISDNEGISSFLDNYPSEGSVQIHLKRDSLFYNSIDVLGKDSYILLLEDEKRIGGVGIFSEKNCYFNGKNQNIGYLSDLRIDEKYRRRGYLARGFKRMRKQFEKTSVPFALTTIMSDNEVATDVLMSKKAGLPNYKHVSDYETIFLGTKKNFWSADSRFSVSKLLENEIDELCEFYEQEGSKRQFFPRYSKNDITEDTGILRGLEYSDIFIARENGNIVGAVSLWDQMPYRRWMIKKYSLSIALFRFCYNIYARLARTMFFPKMGRKVIYKLLSMVLVKDSNPDIFEAILSFIWNSEKAIKDLDLVMCGLASHDPIKKVLSVPGHRFKSGIYMVYWDDCHDYRDQLNDSIPYFELGSL